LKLKTELMRDLSKKTTIEETLMPGRHTETLNKLLRRPDKPVSNVTLKISLKDTEERRTRTSLTSKDFNMRRIESLMP